MAGGTAAPRRAQRDRRADRRLRRRTAAPPARRHAPIARSSTTTTCSAWPPPPPPPTRVGAPDAREIGKLPGCSAPARPWPATTPMQSRRWQRRGEAFGLPKATVDALRARADAVPKQGPGAGGRSAGRGGDRRAAWHSPGGRCRAGLHALYPGHRPRGRAVPRACLACCASSSRAAGRTPASRRPAATRWCACRWRCRGLRRWYSRAAGHRYRLPNAAESRQRPRARPAVGRVSLWLRDCGQRLPAPPGRWARRGARPSGSGR